MGFLGQKYDTNELPEGSGFDLVPPGWYDAEIKKAEVKSTKAGDGTRLNLQFSILGPTHAGRVVFAGLNIELPNSPKAQEIGRQQFGDLLRAIGLDEAEDSDELVGYQVRIRVKIRQQDGYEDSNDVNGFKPYDGGQEAAPARSAPPPKSAPPSRGAPPSRSAPPTRSAPPARAAAPEKAAPSGKRSVPWAKR